METADKEKQIIPVFLGADLNCYNFARAFHEAYGVTSYAFGRYEISATKYSKIINFGVKNCPDSEFVVQLNSDTELLTPNWLEKFIGYAQRKDVGAVGARLYYEDKSMK